MPARGVAGSSLMPFGSKRTGVPAPGWNGGSGQFSRRRSAVIVDEVAAGAGCHDNGQFAGLAVERIVATVLGVAPGNFTITDLSGIGIDRCVVVVDADFPGPAAGRI